MDSVDTNESMFIRILQAIDSAGALQDIVLIGSWVLPVYRSRFGNSPEIPILRTTDVDFLVARQPPIKTKADIPSILEQLGFETIRSPQGGYSKYIHAEMEVDFLTPEYGRGTNKAIPIDALGVYAQPLRYVSLAIDHSDVMPYRGLDVRVPKPGAFLLLKLLVISRRRDSDKARKDRETVRELGAFLIERTEQKEEIVCLFTSLPVGWQNTILLSSEKLLPELARIVRQQRF